MIIIYYKVTAFAKYEKEKFQTEWWWYWFVLLLYKYRGYACPICNKSLVDMTRMWRTLDQEIARTPMPQDYSEFYVVVSVRPGGGGGGGLEYKKGGGAHRLA